MLGAPVGADPANENNGRSLRGLSRSIRGTILSIQRSSGLQSCSSRKRTTSMRFSCTA